MSEGVATTAGAMAQATQGMGIGDKPNKKSGGGPSRRTIKTVKKMARTSFKDFRMKTKVVPSKKEKEARRRNPKHKGLDDND